MSRCPHDEVIAYLEESVFRMEKLWLPVARLARWLAHRQGWCG